MAKRKSTGAKLELCGGIFYVEEFSDGSEKRDEIDGEAVLKLLLHIVEEHAERVIADAKMKKRAR